MAENNTGNHEFKQVAIRLKVKESESLYSPEPVDSAMKAVKLLADFMKDMDRECVYIINLNAKMRPLSFNLAAVGGMSYAPMDPANIFKSAILTNAAHVIVLHVHPSGDTKASQADIEVTKRIALAGTVMGIPLQDHIIVAGESGEFRSMKYDMPELFADTIRLGEERAELLKAESVAEPLKAYEPAPAVQETQKEHDKNIYNEVMLIIRRGQEIEKSTPEAWKLSYEVAEIWSEHNGEKLNEQDFEVQKFIVVTAEDIVKGDTDTIKTSLSNMADRSDDSSFIKKAFKLLISIEHYAEKPQEGIKDAVEAAANIEKADNLEKNPAKSFKDILDQNDKRAEAISAGNLATMMARSKVQKAI